MKLTIETEDFDTMYLLVRFLSDNKFHVRSKDDPTLVGQAPTCDKHNEKMELYIYDRPGSPPGNNWVCKTCQALRAEEEPK